MLCRSTLLTFGGFPFLGLDLPPFFLFHLKMMMRVNDGARQHQQLACQKESFCQEFLVWAFLYVRVYVSCYSLVCRVLGPAMYNVLVSILVVVLRLRLSVVARRRVFA